VGLGFESRRENRKREKLQLVHVPSALFFEELKNGLRSRAKDNSEMGG
jgi:hypothetical protein